MKKYLSFLLFFICLKNFAFGQEQLFPLGSNPILRGINKKNTDIARLTVFSDTIALPFVDDFSRPGPYPLDSLWLDSNVYINSTYSSAPLTIGSATFDGLDKNGLPYNIAAVQDTVADFLTSRPIDLDFNGDTTVWLSFFYQPQGLGDVPEPRDSLILQFKDTSGTWKRVWSIQGKADTAYARVNIRINTLNYQFKGFQFRFLNIATVNGNRDHWNLDYVTLRRNTAANSSIQDNTVLRPVQSLLNEFTSMPYPHYKAFGSQSSLMNTSISDTIYNVDYGQVTYVPRVQILDQNNLSLYTASSLLSAQPPYSGTFNSYSFPLNGFTFPSNPGDSAEFLIKSYFDITGIFSNRNNDTSYLRQKFYNYYSYDDGSAEIAYGLSGNSNVSMAYQFDIKNADTLLGVDIYFNPVGVDISNKLFQLVIWSQVDVASNQATELYREINKRPGQPIGINGFKTFHFNTPQFINAGPIFIGIVQNEPQTLYGIGLDRNTDARSHMFYRVDGNWYASQVKGSWLMRPVFGSSSIFADVNSPELSNFSIYPNPAADYFQVRFENTSLLRHTLIISDIRGAEIERRYVGADEVINTDNLSAGMYFLSMINSRGDYFPTQKLIVR